MKNSCEVPAIVNKYLLFFTVIRRTSFALFFKESDLTVLDVSSGNSFGYVY